MVAANWHYRCPSAASNPVPPVNRLDERIGHYFHQHPVVSRNKFLLDAVRREINFLDPRKNENGPGHARLEGPGTSPGSADWPPLTDVDLRIHGRLNERLEALHRERHSLWSKLRRFLFGSGLVQWLVSGSSDCR